MEMAGQFWQIESALSYTGFDSSSVDTYSVREVRCMVKPSGEQKG